MAQGKSRPEPKTPAKEFVLTAVEQSEWDAILEEYEEVQAVQLDAQAELGRHNARRIRLWAAVCKRLGIRPSELDTAREIVDRVYLK